MNSIDKVIQLLKKGELEEATSHINRITSTESAEDILMLADEISQLGFINEAKKLYEYLLELYPGEGELLISIAEILIENDQEDEAILILEKVSPDDSLYPSALLLEADLYQLDGMPEVSERKLLEAKELLPEEVIIDFALGELYHHQGRNLEAISTYIKVLEHETEIGGVSIHQRLAEVLSASGQFEEALPYFEKALEHQLEINTLFEYAFTAYQAGMYKTAIQKFIELKELDPEYQSLYLYLGRSYEHLEELDQALKTVKEGLRIDEYNKDLFVYGGKIALKKGLEEEAETFFQNALALDPGYLEAAITLCKLYLHNERYEDVLECIKEIRKYGEDDPQFDWLEAVSLHKLEQYNEALNCYHKAYNYYKNNEDFLSDYGFFLIENGDQPNAKSIFTRLIQINPMNEEYILILDRLQESSE